MKWVFEGGKHILYFDMMEAVFTISVFPNMIYRTKGSGREELDKEFPWVMETQLMSASKSDRYKYNHQHRALLREENVEDAKAKALFATQSVFLNALTKIDQYRGQNEKS